MIYEYYQKYQKERNIFLPLSEIKKKAEGKTDQYCSIFGYKPEDIMHGDIYAPLYFDVDNLDLTKAYHDAQNLISILNFYSLTNQDYKICFSGSKGFHITIYPEVLNLSPRPDLDKIFKHIAHWFYPQLTYNSLDFKVYERRRLWRIINTINGKTGLYKIEITRNENLKEILEKAKTPQPLILKNPIKNGVACEWLSRAISEMEEEKTQTKRFSTNSRVFEDPINSSIKELIKTGVAEGNRNNTAFYLACYLNSKNLSQLDIENYLMEFGGNCNPPIHQQEINSVIKSALKTI